MIASELTSSNVFPPVLRIVPQLSLIQALGDHGWSYRLGKIQLPGFYQK